MRFRRSAGSADRAESERLLDGIRDGRPPTRDADPLVRLLAAAAAPANPGELSGEEQALAAFRAARAHPAPAPARAPRRHGVRIGAVAWVAGLAATATAGIAFATVSLDRPEQPATPPAPATPASSGPGVDGSPSHSGSGTPTEGGATPSVAPTPTGATPGDAPGGATGRPDRPAGVTQLTGLCRSYQAKPAAQRAKALKTPAYADLVTAAGGADRIEAYCLRLVPAASPKPSPDARNTRSPGPTAVPSPAAPTHRTGTGRTG
ncbi:hypothetical protein ACFO0M_15150 [Micromonospora mangrovi]|uniref:Uncharacterized protein n=2 Tax=Micromonospora TaxID=1873 RepID=A0AAU7MGW3_9ACTN